MISALRASLRGAFVLSVLAFGASTAAQAGVVFATGNPGGSFDNVLFNNNPPDGTTLSGVLNSTPYLVTFTGTESLHGNGGQARLEATTGGLNYVEFVLGPANNLGFDRAVFNFNTDQDALGGSATITAYDQLGGSFISGAFSLAGNGQHFINLDTTGSTLITRVVIQTTADFRDLRQIRIDGAQAISAAVPEPTTWAMMLLGFGGLSFVAYRKRKAATVVA